MGAILPLVLAGVLAVGAAGDLAWAGNDVSPQSRSIAAARCEDDPGRAYRNCPGRTYRVTVRASASNSDGDFSGRGTYELVFLTDVRHRKVERRGSYAPTIALATGPKGSRLVRVGGSASAADATCSARGSPLLGRFFGGVAGNPSIIRRDKRPRTVYYDLSLSAFIVTSYRPPLEGCSLIPGGDTRFEKRLRSSDYEVSIRAGVEVGFAVRLYFHRWQRAGRMESPLDRLTRGRPFELRVSGQYDDNVHSSQGSAHIIFEPVR